MLRLAVALHLLLAVSCQTNRPPYITRSINGIRVKEDTVPGTTIGRVEAVDPEGYGIQYQMTSESFSINSRTGNVILVRPLDYETTPNVEAVIKVNSFDDPVQVVTSTATVRVQDVNDVAPVFTADVFTGSVNEDAPAGTVVVATVSATDRDTVGPGLTVECDVANEGSQFKGVCQRFTVRRVGGKFVQRWTGEIVLNGTLSFREKTVWQIPLKATDGVNPATQSSAEIRVIDVQNEPPIFISSMNVQTIELAFDGNVLADVVAVDQDASIPRNIIYSIVSNPGDLFRINTVFGSSPAPTGVGKLENAKPLDRDLDPLLADGFISIILMAREIINASAGVFGNDSTTTATATMVITVTGVNDNAPKFSQTAVTVNLTEDAPNGSPLPGLSLTVSDIDQDDDAVFSLSLISAPTADVFEVHPASGKELANVGVRVKDSSKLDYDGPVKSLGVILVATETKSKVPLSSSCFITVNLVDVNDLSPVFNRSSYSFSVSETAPAGRVVASGVEATDADTGNFGTAGIRYAIIGNGADKFRILDPTKPVVTVAPCSGVAGVGPACLDRETQASYNLFLVATDNLGTGNSNSTQLIVEVVDENDNTPTFASASGGYEFYIDEGRTTGSPVFQVLATDADSSLNGNNRIQYSLLDANGSSHSGLWQILPGGVITATRPVDYEAIPGGVGYYELVAQATDSAPPFRQSTAKVRINVLDLNDNAPVFRRAGPIDISIVEGKVPSKWLTDLVADDADLSSTPNGRVTYWIRAGAQDKFTINVVNGSLYTTATATFQYDVQQLYVLTVVAEDSGRPKLQATLTVNVRIIDTNNRLPYFLVSPKRVQIPESSSIGTFVTAMAAEDRDLSSRLNYSVLAITYRNPSGVEVPSNSTLFSLDASTANVTVASRLERDIVAEATIVVHVADLNATTPQTATGSLIIVVMEVNDQGPTFASPWTLAVPFYNISVEEEQSFGSFVTVITATDPDGPISGYSIVTDPLNAFAISPAGIVSLRGRLDFESLESTHFVVVAVDSGTPRLSATATVNVTIVNVNDESPTMGRTQYRFSLPESFGPAPGRARPNQLLGVVNASDTDKGDFGRLTFSLVSDEFYIVASATSAEIFANGSAYLDREASGQRVLQLQVADSPLTPSVRRYTTVPIYVDLLDVNDNAPEFSVADYYVTVGNNAPIGSVLVTMAATDPDLNSTLTFSLDASSASADFFAVGASTGVLTTAKSLRDKSGSLLLRAVVSDGVFNATCFVHVTVLESSRSRPRWLFPGPNDTLQVLEEQYLGLVITRLQAQADNSSSSDATRLTYGLVHNGNFVQETPLFKVNPVTGVLTANAIFDREAEATHLLNVAVRDQRVPPLESRLFVTVRILDVDDHAPSFSLASYAFSVAETATVDSSVGRVAATDADAGENAVVRFSIVSGNAGAAFRVDAATGELFVAKQLDRETTAVYSLRVSAASGAVAASSVVVVNITVADVNDNVPTFSSATYHAAVPFNSPFGHVVARVSASDPDYADNAIVAYGVTDAQNLFSVDAGGRVTLVDLSRSAGDAAYVAVVSAWNPNRPTAVAKATLRVWFSSTSSVAKLTVGANPDWVAQHLAMLRDQLLAATNASRIFVQRVRYHLNKNGVADLEKSDVLVSGVGADGRLLSGSAIAAAVRERLAGSNAASLQFLRLQSSVTYDEESEKFDVSLPIVLAICVLVVLLLCAVAYLVALYCMQRSLSAAAHQAAANGNLQVLRIHGVHKRNVAFDDKAFD